MSVQVYRWLCVLGCLLIGCAEADGYEYPFADPYVATVVATPAEFAQPLPEVPEQVGRISMFPEREVPGVLWNLDQLSYAYSLQDGPAPLIFMIAGTGSSYKSGKMRMMQKAFYQAGFHVVCLTSPTHPNFIVAASTSGVPGHLEEDSADLYRVMQRIWQKIQDMAVVTEFHLTGYSLGGAEAAFISRIDEREKKFKFSRVLMINPPVSLYSSVAILDEMLEDSIPGGMKNFTAFYRKVVKAFSETYAHGDRVEFNDEFLYEAYKYHQPQTDAPLRALIGVSFRSSCQNMAFTADVLTGAGYVVPRGLRLGRFDRATPYLKTLSELSFIDYFRDLFVPHFQAADPGLTEAALIEQMSLKSIEPYLRTASKIGLVHNEDDVILRPGELAYLRTLFGERATVYPSGGHCGNMAFPENVKAMTGFFLANDQPVERTR